MAGFGTTYNPSAVMMGRPATGSGPYLWSGGGAKPPGGGTVGLNPTQQGSGPAPSNSVGLKPTQYSSGPGTTPQPAAGNVVGPESIRATGTGPFDQAYRQNLATYAGGQFSRPGGTLNFNPTDVSTFPGMPTGGGTAPVTGMPQSLLDMALSGRGFSWNSPQPAATATKPPQFPDMQFWMDQFMRGGRGQRQGSFL